jgi:hypothetical protein
MDWKKEGVMEGVSAPGWKNRRRRKNGLYFTVPGNKFSLQFTWK